MNLETSVWDLIHCWRLVEHDWMEVPRRKYRWIDDDGFLEF
jgi:hypothetical protein